MSHDVVIRGGSVIDGTGGPARTADVAITDGVITAVGRVEGKGRQEVEADGAIVTPGFVDIHTHYDGQVTWDDRFQPSSAHGVTTVLMGNCGIGFAPVRPGDKDQLIELVEGVEDLPGPVLHEGMPWNWETMEEYLDVIDSRPMDLDFAAQIAHGPLRLYVMGQRAANREKATAADIAEMGRIAADAIKAGALGFSTSRTTWHKTVKGAMTPDFGSAREELVGISRAIGETGSGVLQVVTDFEGFDDEVENFYEMMRASGRPLSVSLLQMYADADPRKTLRALEVANEEGLQMTGVTAARAIGILVDFEGTLNPWQYSATFQSGADIRNLDVKRRIIAEIKESGPIPAYDRIWQMDQQMNYEPEAKDSIAARAARDGRDPAELLYEVMLEGPAYKPVFNYFDGNLDTVREMLAHPNTLHGLSDGGAHVGTICDASFSTTMLSHWGRDRTRGEKFELPWIIERQTRANASAIGLGDRGVLAPGYKADVNVIDFANLRNHIPHIVADLPAGGRRVMQGADGYLHTFVSGAEIYRSGEATGQLPGRLVRGGKSAPVA